MSINIKQKVCLIIRDGWGSGKQEKSNAIFSARTPHADRYESEFPTTGIETSGLAVGLPDGYQGNSEVGHLNIGAGRVIYQSLTRIDKDIETGNFRKNEAIVKAIETAKERNSTLHLIGLIQEEGVHSVTRHCHEILNMCKDRSLENVYIHAITDGRDTPPSSAEGHMAFLEEGMKKAGTGRLATMTGRYFVMDRDKRWDRTELAYNAIVKGEGRKEDNWRNGLKNSYDAGETDEFIKPVTFDYSGMNEGDVVIFFNFRFDRTRQLTQAMVEKDFSEFPREEKNLHFVAMTHYYDNGNFEEAFPELTYENILGEYLSNNGLKQLRCAETEKYAHVTFFFNALKNEPFEGEDRILVDSPKVATYDLKPEMSAYEVRDKLVEAIDSEKYDVVICNFANCDMVGHTGVYEKIVEAVETVDTCVHDVCEAFLKKGGAVILTADHGNADQTQLEDGSPMTAHTVGPVPVTVAGAGDIKLRKDGSLCDIAPTMLQLLGLKQPEEMSGKSLIEV